MSNRWSELAIQYRKDMDLTQVKLAEHLGIAPNTISRWETGKYSVSSDFTWILAEKYFGAPDTSEISQAIRFLSGLQASEESSRKELL